MRERECVKTQSIENWSVFVGSLWLSIPRSDACVLHMTGMWRVRTDWDSCVLECLASKVFSWDTCEIFYFAGLSFLIHTFCAYTIYTHFTHRCWGVLLRENSSHKSWELEIVISIILYTNFLWIFVNPTSLFPYHLKLDSPNTYHTISECSMRF